MPSRKKPPATSLTVTRKELLVDGSDLQFRQLLYDCLAFFNRLRAMRDVYAGIVGVNGIQYTILASIYHFGARRRLGIGDLANHLHFSPSFVTIHVGRLVAKGLIRKVTDKQDKRRVVLTVTPEGRRRLVMLSKMQSQVNNIHFGTITRAEFETLCRTMPALVESTDRALGFVQHLAPSARKTLDTLEQD
jgi:DNA-binding MarR family transcriptional regulator